VAATVAEPRLLATFRSAPTSCPAVLDKLVFKCIEEEASGGFRTVVAYSEAELRKILNELTEGASEPAVDQDPEAGHPPSREEDPDADRLHEPEEDPDAGRLHQREEDPDACHPHEREKGPNAWSETLPEQDPDEPPPVMLKGKTREAIMDLLALRTKLSANLREAYRLLTNCRSLSENGKALAKAIERYMD
jgi:hypothetical protein